MAHPYIPHEHSHTRALMHFYYYYYYYYYNAGYYDTRYYYFIITVYYTFACSFSEWRAELKLSERAGELFIS